MKLKYKATLPNN